ncbi:MAG: hypothetical protein ACI9YL_000970 [Luteibaculaceae bacterium]
MLQTSIKGEGVKKTNNNIMRILAFISAITLSVNSLLVSAQSQNDEDRFTMHGYMDIVFLAANSKPLDRDIAFLSMYRTNIMPQYVISSKFKATILLEGADLFRLDEASDSDKPGIVEWAYLTYNHNSHFNLKVGTFAVPFGIYNERFYASPTQLTSFLPSSLYFKHNFKDESGNNFSTFLFPRSPSGLMIFGKLANSGKHYLSYQTYYGNESPGGSLIGLNKYVGGRIRYENANDKIRIGSSYNAYLDANKLVNSALGFDVELNFNNFQLSTEYIAAKIGKRDSLSANLPGEFYQSRGGYFQLGYTIKETVTPYFRYDLFDHSTQFNDDQQTTLVSGVNIAFHPQVIFKVEAYLSRFQDVGKDKSNILISTLSIAF